MNGTSLDGVDFTLTQVYKAKPHVRFLKHQSFLFPKNLRLNLLKATQHQLRVNELALLHHGLGRFYAACFQKLKFKKQVQLIGLHGQTVFHQGLKKPQATLQIGEASYLAAVAKVPVVADFRTADMALGGQGAPIATLFHQLAFATAANKNNSLAVHNLGGISNLSIIKSGKVIAAFDTGPANMLLDLCIQRHSQGKIHFDKNGQQASLGHVDQILLKKMLKHPYFKKKHPKSCGREEFGEVFFDLFLGGKKKSSSPKRDDKLSLQDQLATLTELTAVSIARSYQQFAQHKIQRIVFCGGGSKNAFLLSRIQQHLPGIAITTCEQLGWPTEAIEGAAFALLAAYRIWNIPSNLPQTTGALRQTSMGKIVFV